jgi:hypothetical protein
VQTEVLPSLGRIAAASKAIAILKPLIEQTQGAISPADLGREIPAPVPPAQAARSWQPPAAPQPVVGSASGGMIHGALYGTMLLDAAAGFFKHEHPEWHMYFLVSSLLLLALCTLSIVAVVRQRKSSIPAALRGLTVLTFGWVLAVLFVVFLYGFSSRIVYTATHPGRLPPGLDLYSMPGFWWVSFVADIIEAGLGGAGLGFTLTYYLRREGRGARAEREEEL